MGIVEQDPVASQTQAELTQLLNDASRGDPRAAEALLPLVYDQLRRLARAKMRQERPDQTLQATALVHEAYLRLVDQTGVGGQQQWAGRWQFFAAAAEAMRRILIEYARRRSRAKRGGGMQRVSLDHAQSVSVNESTDDLLALDEALNELAQRDPQKAQLVKLRFFGGLTKQEASEALGISTATGDRQWAFARAWLYRRMRTQ